MVTQGNETFIQLKGVVRSSSSEESNTTIYIKGAWYPKHFLLLVMDGIDAWRIDATENVVTLRSRSLRLSESEYVDKAHAYLGQQHSSSLYSLHRTSSESVQLMCTPTDKQYTIGFNLELILKKAPAVSVTFDMLQFMMQAHRDLSEQSECKTRMFERTKAAMEKTIIELEKEKHDMESELLPKVKAAEEEEDDEDVGVMTVLSPAAKRRKKDEHSLEKKGSSARKKPQWSSPIIPPESLVSPPTTSKVVPRYSNGSKEVPKSGSKARRGIMTPTKIINMQSVSEPKYGNSWGAQPKFSVGAAAHSEDHQTAEEEEDDDDNDDDDEDDEDEEEDRREKEEEKIGRLRHKEMIIAAANVEGCFEGSRLAAGDLAFTEQHYRLKNANKGRKATGSTKEGSRATASCSKPRKGGGKSAAISVSKQKGDIEIEEQVVKGIKLLTPYTASRSTGGQDGEEKKRRSRSDEQSPTLSKKRSKPSGIRKGHRQSSEKKVGSLQQISSQAHSGEANSQWPNASLLPLPDSDDEHEQQHFGVLENNYSLTIVPVNHEQKKFNVISADIHDFDSERMEKAIALHQFWALYDDKDGMPRFYGRITKLIHSPFEVTVEWLEPYCPVVRQSGLVKSAALSTACGEFQIGIECPQTLAAFSHRVEIDEVIARTIFQFYPKKGEVWALYRNWSKPKPEKADAAIGEEEENVKFEYELVEVHSDYSKEKGVKVAPIYKVPGFTTLFKSGASQASTLIPAKDVLSRFSHQIFTYQVSGDEKQGVPKDSLELDPAATPLEYLEQPDGYDDGGDDFPATEVEALQTVSESG